MRTVIAGLGKTGTTALFSKIREALPDDTWCLFEPRTYEAPSNGAAHVLAKVLFGYNRTLDIAGFLGFDRKIVLVRDSRDTLVSRVLYDIYNEPAFCADEARVDAFVELLRRKEADPAGVPVRDLITLFDQTTRRPLLPRAIFDAGAALDFQRAHPDFFQYRYEDLVRADYAAVESYLGFALGPGPASVPAQFDRVVRTRGAGDWRNWLTPADVTFFRPYFAPYLAFNAYPDDWTLAAEPRIRPEHGSGYVLRLVEERRALMAAS